MRYPMRLELTRICSLNDFQLVIGIYRYIHRQKLLGKKFLVNFKLHTHKKSPQDTHLDTCIEKKITVCEIQNHPNAHTHTHNDKNLSNIKERKSRQSVKVHKYLSQDRSLFYARVTSGQSGT